MLTIKKLIKADLDANLLEQELLNIKKMMKKVGNPQWDECYPLVQDFEMDISNGVLYGFYENNKLIGLCALTTNYEEHYYQNEHSFKYYKPTDDIIYIHRVLKYNFAQKYTGTDLLKLIIKEFLKNHDAIQIDTNQENIPMNRAIIKSGFNKSGTFQLEHNKCWNTYEIY